VNPEQASKNEDLIKKATVDNIQNNGVTLTMLNLSDGGNVKMSSICSQSTQGDLIYLPEFTQQINSNIIMIFRTWGNTAGKQKFQLGRINLN
jgi:hypothetical protein